MRADVTNENDLRESLDSCSGQLIIYFALPATVTEKVCRVLTGLDPPAGSPQVRRVRCVAVAVT
ncbi:hypothetical protein [Nocardia sp. NPDC058480]|uniref:hypothetical protein n=1 Tax=Nocardia sp. NPDC058480 TaxID=3346522 RepID=UPI0036669B5E